MQPIVCFSIQFLNGKMVCLETERPEFYPLCPSPELKWSTWTGWWRLQVGPIRALKPRTSAMLPALLPCLTPCISCCSLQVTPLETCLKSCQVMLLFAVLNNTFGILLWYGNVIGWCAFFFLLPVNLSALMLSSCPFTEWWGWVWEQDRKMLRSKFGTLEHLPCSC